MAARMGVRLLRWLVPPIMMCITLFTIGASVMAAVDFSPKPVVPEVSQADRDTMNQAEDQLKKIPALDGYKPVQVIPASSKQADFLNKQLASVPGEHGPYVIMRPEGVATIPAAPGTDIKPDVITDSAQGVIVALSQTYSTERYALCYNDGNVRTMSSKWSYITLYLWGKFVGNEYTLSHDEVPQLPSGWGNIPCNTYSNVE